MRNTLFTAGLLITCTLNSTPVKADQLTVGNDIYLSGSSAVLSEPSSRDAFVSGFNVDIKARVEKDVHAAGFNVNFDAPIGSDAYAAGFSVQIAQPVGGDLTASAFNISVSQSAALSGNVRLAARSITLDGAIGGSLIAAAGDLTMNDVVSSDAVLTVGTLKFGTNAKINGKLKYYAQEPITIPASVITADRVQFEKLTVSNAAETIRENTSRGMSNMWPSFVSVIAGVVLLIGFLVAMGAVILAFAPRWMEDLKNEALHSPIRITALGMLGLSLVIGLVPVSGMTLIGIPLIPVAMLAAMGLWILGYVGGAYAIGARFGWASNSGSSSMGSKVAVLATTIVILSLLNFIPIIGWLVNLAVLFLGLGAILMQMARYITREEPHIAIAATVDPVVVPAPTPAPTRRSRSSK
jgi:hypothetical protein